MVKARRLSALLLMLIVCLCLNCCTNPAYAFVTTETQTEQPEQTQLDDLQDWSNPNALTPEGNLTLVDDMQTFSSSDKEFLTVQTKSGNYFYIIIERDKDGKQNVHFLNQVDESDLLALLEEEPVEKTPPVCICKGQDKCFIGSVNTACEVCAVSMQACLGKEAAQIEPEPESKGNPAAALGILLVLLAMLGAGGFYLYKSYLTKKANKQQAVSNFDEDDEDDDYLKDFDDVEEEELTEDNVDEGDDEET